MVFVEVAIPTSQIQNMHENQNQFFPAFPEVLLSQKLFHFSLNVFSHRCTEKILNENTIKTKHQSGGVNKPLVRPYFWGGGTLGGRLTSHD